MRKAAPKKDPIQTVPYLSKLEITQEGLVGKWFFGAATDSDGDVFCLPYSKFAFAFIGGRGVKLMRIDGSDGCKWLGVAAGGDGHLYGSPFNSDCVVCISRAREMKKGYATSFVIDDRDLDFIKGAGSEHCKWAGAASGPDGHVYCAPYNADKILVINTEKQELRYIDLPCEDMSRKGRAKWAGAALGSNGRIYCAPYDADSVLVIDCETETVEFIEGVPRGSAKWFGAAADAEGNVYFAPHNEEAVLVVNIWTQTLAYLNTGVSGIGKWSGACRGFDGNIYFVPFNSDSVLMVRPTDRKMFFMKHPEFIDESLGKWFGASMDRDGKIICSPWNNNDVLVIHTKPPVEGAKRNA